MIKNIQIFEEFAQEYDEWFDKNRFIYESEVFAMKKFIPKSGKGLEIGVGTGRFAVPCGIKIGVEPAKAMADRARRRGIEVYEAKAEKLPLQAASFDFVLMVTVLCFLKNPLKTLKEATRVLKPGGHMIIGMIDKDSPLGRIYESKRKESKFYRYAHFYSVHEVIDWLKSLYYKDFQICQTIFRRPEEITGLEPVKDGYGEGGFVAIKARKGSEKIV